VCLASGLVQCRQRAEPANRAAKVSQVRSDPQELQACAAEDQWPPYDYLAPSGGGKVVGASVDTLREVFRRTGRTVNVVALPWKRCLHDVELGQFQVALNASANAERRRLYFISPALYRVNQTLYYLASAKGQFGDAPTMTTLAHMREALTRSPVRVCGLFGYNLSVFPIGGLALDQSPKSAAQAIAMLRRGRCSLVIGYREPWDAAARLGMLDLSGTERADIEEVPHLAYHFLSTRAAPDATALAQTIAEGVEALRRDGTLQRLFAAYGVTALSGASGGSLNGTAEEP